MKNSEYMLFPATEESHDYKRRQALWFFCACASSIALYWIVFSNLKMPYSIGIYERMLDVKKSHFMNGKQPRLLIAAGSNARVSHRAVILEEELGIPVTNGGLSAAVSTAFVLDSYMPVLKSGDICYLPLEYEPLLLEKRKQHLDARYALAYDKEMLAGFTLKEQSAAVFSHELNHVFSSAAETIIVRHMGTTSGREEIDERGDQVLYDEAIASRFRQALETMEGPEIPGPEILDSEPEMVGKLIEFLDWCSNHGILAIGGLPTTFEDTEIDMELVEGLRELYESRGHAFVVLPNLSRYPRSMFYDSKYHLSKSSAIQHSRNLAKAIRPIVQAHRERSRH